MSILNLSQQEKHLFALCNRSSCISLKKVLWFYMILVLLKLVFGQNSIMAFLSVSPQNKPLFAKKKTKRRLSCISVKKGFSIEILDRNALSWINFMANMVSVVVYNLFKVKTH